MLCHAFTLKVHSCPCYSCERFLTLGKNVPWFAEASCQVMGFRCSNKVGGGAHGTNSWL